MLSLSQIKSELNKISERSNIIKTQQIKIQNNSIVFLNGETSYFPSKTAEKYHDDDSIFKLIMGPIRSGKSTASCAEIIKRACAMPISKDGVRRSICAIIRNTYPELKTTTLLTWKRWFGSLGLVHEKHDSPIELFHRFNDGNGIVELKIWFMALDKPKDLKKLLSLEITFAYVNEVREIPFSLIKMLMGRVGQYPMKKDCENEFWSGVFADTNPPDIEHWIYDIFEKQQIKEFKLFKQPAALLKNENNEWILNENAENIKNLSKDYYHNLLPGANQEYINVYIRGDYGTVNDGKLVYSQYNDDVHSIQTIDTVINEPILISLDGGLTPAALISQLINGQFRCLKEFTTDKMLLEELVQNVILYVNANFKNYCVNWTGDPSINSFDIAMLNNLGINLKKAVTNDIEPRINSVSFFLNRMSSGSPSFLISKIGCPNARKGFLSKYCYRRIQVIGEEKYRDVPDKSHPYSDIQDCIQYACLWYNNSNISKDGQKFKELFNN